MLIVWKTYFSARSQTIIPGDGKLMAQKTLQRRLQMAKMLLLTFAWTVLCNVPYFVLVGQFGWVLNADPISGLWQQVLSTSQYAFTPCILLLSNVEYRSRLLQILRRMARAKSISHGDSDGAAHT
ncbi:hypothetical protein BV898_13523 [Hypsibius exemplaris]|uniref:Uncharacterized protein n=1 Tax=Hypsibius exemplaris TaxID=2072580 RepID=A0A1W0WAG1_HYPEX|nr:hypothetical protein BV898_13523 [Hypsibius exemplaris]